MNKKIHFDVIKYFTRPKQNSDRGCSGTLNIDEKTSVILWAIKKYADEENIKCVSKSTALLPEETALFISIGGDGTMLGAMRAALEHPNSYVFGINTGTLGFLTEEIEGNVIDVLKKIEIRSGLIEERMALTGNILIDGEIVKENVIAVNEFTMSSMTLQRPLTIDVTINQHQISSVVGSGMLVATSTGSTAMALSGGGAIISPSTNVMQIVPIMPHTLTSRPIITTGRDTITMNAQVNRNISPVEIYGDGIFLGAAEHDVADKITIRIRKHKNKIKVYRPPNWNFFDVLSRKMKW